MKKIYLFVILSLVCFSLVGCKNKEDVFEYGGQIAPYLHEVFYDDYLFDEKGITVGEFDHGCSVVRNGNFIGRNFDYFFDNIPEFIVHVKGNENRYASVGVARVPIIKEADLLSNNVSDEYFQLIPNIMMDGINEKGVFVCNNVVSNEGNLNKGTDTTKEDFNILFISRKILDCASDATEAIDIMRSYNLVGDIYGIENLHFMICDENKTFVVEIINDQLVVKEKTGDLQIMTNFLCNAETMNEHPSGVERYNILKENYSLGSTFKGMQDLLYKARFSQSYNPTENPVWASDAGVYTYSQLLNGEAYVSYKQTLENGLYEAFVNDYNNNIRCDDPSNAWWITVSNSTYDIKNKTLSIYVQENYNKCYQFNI